MTSNNGGEKVERKWYEQKIENARTLHAYYMRRWRESNNRWRNHRREQMREQAKNYIFWKNAMKEAK